MYTKDRMLSEYSAELAVALQMKADGVTMVPADVAGTDAPISIDAYIKVYLDAIADVSGGADPEQYNY